MKMKLIIIFAIALILILAIPHVAQANDTEKKGSIELKISSVPAYNSEGNNVFNGMTVNAYQLFRTDGSEETGWSYIIHDDFKGFKYNGLSGYDLIEYIRNLENDSITEWTDIFDDNNISYVRGQGMRELTEALMKYIRDNNIQRTGYTEIPKYVARYDKGTSRILPRRLKLYPRDDASGHGADCG